jgi:hypothetical protein
VPIVEDVLVELQQAGSSEFADGGIVQSRYRVWLGASAPLSGWDAIEVDGQTFELDGDANAVWNPTLRTVHHVECEVVLTR